MSACGDTVRCNLPKRTDSDLSKNGPARIRETKKSSKFTWQTARKPTWQGDPNPHFHPPRYLLAASTLPPAASTLPPPAAAPPAASRTPVATPSSS
jgi:hypothetical protein